ncbi:synapse differentiation-inducing gene protein 1-like [Centropristis striata]|uniref:synapse differentiation-inducing gene protein 1-like n=1 Tax=Centropristis striata TaxID=184440 RepID=UPI0027E0D5D5|nr:synapse differentiation-inducing gene protein 1-like [Centropristis striata]
MDPSKSASAPPTDWTDEKSSMAHAPPPPYQDQPGAGHPQQQGFGPPPQYGGAPYGQQPMGQQYPGQQYPGQPYPGQPYPGQQYPGQPYPGQQATVTVQPTVYVARGPLEHPLNDYLCYSIFNLVCCCLPLGIAALIYSIFTREANRSGDRIDAERNSRIARTLNHVGLGIGLGVIVLTIVYAVVMASLVHN